MASIDPSVALEFFADFEEVIEEEDCFNKLKKAIKERPELLHSKNEGGQCLTEYLCEQEPGPYVRDVLDDLIDLGAVVTEDCYRSVIYNDAEMLSVDMIESLIKSGYFPTELPGEDTKTLDLIVDQCDSDSEEMLFEGAIQFLLGSRKKCSNAQIERMQMLPTRITIGATHANDGSFARWVEENKEDIRNIYGKSLDLVGSDIVMTEVTTTCDNESPAPKVLNANSNNAVKNEDSPTSATADLSSGRSNSKCTTVKNQEEGDKKGARKLSHLHCPVCSLLFESEEQVREHIYAKTGKAHNRYRKQNSIPPLKKARIV